MLVDEPGPASFAAESLDGTLRLAPRRVTIPDAEACVVDLDFVGASVAGVVIEEETGKPIAGALVQAAPASLSLETANTRTGPDGSFRFDLEPGRYRLIADARTSGYGRAEIDATVDASGTSGVRIPLSRGLAIAGRVVDPGGGAASGIEVSVMTLDAAGQASSSGSARSLPDGAFHVGGLGPRPHTVIAQSSLGQFAIRTGVVPDERPLEIALRPGGRIRAQVVDPDGRPLEGAWTSVVGVDGAPLQVGGSQTDARGVVELMAPAGNIELRAARERFEGRVTVRVSPNALVPAQVRLWEHGREARNLP
jgi:hypothetical protein